MWLKVETPFFFLIKKVVKQLYVYMEGREMERDDEKEIKVHSLYPNICKIVQFHIRIRSLVLINVLKMNIKKSKGRPPL